MQDMIFPLVHENDKARQIAAMLSESIPGVSPDIITPQLCIYDSFFVRYERPDYKVYAGMYCYDRIKNVLPRDEFTVKSGDNLLAAYYYNCSDARGLVILAHGFHAGADDYLPLIEAIVNRGYSVITYDVTGTYSSKGDSIIGMCQSLIDLDNVLNYVKSSKQFMTMPKLLIGHSWGGYAVSSALALHTDIKACVCLAPINDGTVILDNNVEKHVPDDKELLKLFKHILRKYQQYLFGDYVKYNGVIGINSTKAHVLIAQGVDDTIVTPTRESITAHLDEITNPNVTLYHGTGYQGSHTGIWHSDEAEAYKKELEAAIRAREVEIGGKLPYEELVSLYSNVDHRLISDVNTELIDLIIETFDKGIAN